MHVDHPSLVVAAVIRRGERLLVGRRPPGKRHGGMWEFPGGKVLPDESTRAAIARELREELALELHSLGRTLFDAEDPGSAFLIRFLEVSVRGTPTPLEHSDLAWRDPVALSRMGLAPADARFVREVLAPPRARGPSHAHQREDIPGTVSRDGDRSDSREEG